MKPCPFCGTKVKVHQEGTWHSVGCDVKKCLINPSTLWYKSEQCAINAWEKRN